MPPPPGRQSAFSIKSDKVLQRSKRCSSLRMNNSDQKFQPILLGSDATVYGVARAFHEEYGIKSIALASRELFHTKHSKIVEVRAIKGFSQLAVFTPKIVEFAQQYRQDNPDTVLLLIPLGDVYVNLVSQAQEQLRPYYVFNTIDYQLCRNLALKNYFYQVCEEHGLPYPKTWYFNAQSVAAQQYKQIDLPTPLVMKPANSTKWLEVDFPGRKKAYVFDRLEEFYHFIQLAYHSGYDDDMVVQDFIPGQDDSMLVINMYVDQHSQVRMMAAGQILVEDKSPKLVGNYNAIRVKEKLPVMDKIAAFLRAINYRGVANFDLKYDRRDGEYKLFEINLRNGASSYFVTLNGQNLAKYYVDDLVYQLPFSANQPVLCQGDYLSTVLAKSEILTAVANSKHLPFVQQAYAHHRYANPLRYAKDLSLRRRYILWRLSRMHKKNFYQYFPKRTVG